MIIEEQNLKKEKEEKRLKLKKMWDVDLPNEYEMEWELYPIIINRKGRWKGYPAANVTLKDVDVVVNPKGDIIRIVFNDDCEKDLEILRSCLHQSNNKFSVEVIGEDY